MLYCQVENVRHRTVPKYVLICVKTDVYMYP
jgi:hypothetical protein